MIYNFSFTIEDCHPGMVRFIKDQVATQRWEMRVIKEEVSDGLNYTLKFKDAETRHQFLELMEEHGLYVEESKPTE